MMSRKTNLVLSLALLATAVCASAWALGASPAKHKSRATSLSPSVAPPVESPEFARVVNAIIDRENAFVVNLEYYRPRMEIYIQDMHYDRELGPVPVKDHYFLGRVTVRSNRTVAMQSLLPGSAFGHHALGDLTGEVTQFLALRYQPSDFYFSIAPDTNRFDRKHYKFQFVRREFLGNVRCLVFDVSPTRQAMHSPLRRWDAGLFKGRIWVEDEHYHIVRFNGGFTPAPPGSVYFHFDSWREELQPGLWLPVYAYSEESGDKYGFDRALRFRAEVRFWGYGLKNPNHQSEMTEIQVNAPTGVKDASQTGDLSPVGAEREWQQQAQNNVLDRLQKAGLLAPPSPVDKVLETVVNNLIVTNHLYALPPVHCRVLLTSTLESLAVGDTILVSRGLIDVLPDEASLAAMLAHELAHIVLQQTTNIDSSKWAFADRLMIPDQDVLKVLSFKPNERDEEAADAKALKLLRNSPYKNQLRQAGLFLKAMVNMAPHTPQLFGAHLGSRLVLGKHHVNRLAQLMIGAPKLQRARVSQIAALPLGGRVEVNPWSDTVELMKTKPVALLSAHEKMPFEITPMFPYLTRLPPEEARK
ncbi:MAG: M48 family metalloprotease [Terriglobia bacterium]